MTGDNNNSDNVTPFPEDGSYCSRVRPYCGDRAPTCTSECGWREPSAPPVASDPVNLPHHYARFAIEPMRFITENKLGFLQGNIIKYVCRWDAKDGIQDLRKAKRCIEMLIKFLEGDVDWWRRAT